MDRRALQWICVILEILCLVGMIWYFSSQVRSNSANISSGIIRWLLERFYPGFSDLAVRPRRALMREMNIILRKLAHFGEFALMGQALLSLMRLIRPAMRLRASAAIAWGGAVALASLDEVHQVFVAGRGPQATDVLIDSLGAAFGILLTALVLRRMRHKTG